MILRMCCLFFEKKRNAKYAIWGITQKADMICNYMEEHYPDAKLVAVQDKSKKIMFHNIESKNDMMQLVKGVDFIFVTAATANDSALNFFNTNNISDYHISTDGIAKWENT